MENKKNRLRVVLSLCALLGWWGMLFPELALTPDTVKIVTQTESPTEHTWEYGDNLYMDLLHASPDNVTYNFKFISTISSFWEALKDGSD